MLTRLWRNHALVAVYAIGWLICWGLHAAGEYWQGTYPAVEAVPWHVNWLTTSFENLASEYHQVGMFVLLSIFFISRGSPQSRDGDERIEAKLDRLLADRRRRLP